MRGKVGRRMEAAKVFSSDGESRLGVSVLSVLEDGEEWWVGKTGWGGLQNFFSRLSVCQRKEDRGGGRGGERKNEACLARGARCVEGETGAFQAACFIPKKTGCL